MYCCMSDMMHANKVDAVCCCACSSASEACCAYQFRSVDHPGVALIYALLFPVPFHYLARSLTCLLLLICSVILT